MSIQNELSTESNIPNQQGQRQTSENNNESNDNNKNCLSKCSLPCPIFAFSAGLSIVAVTTAVILIFTNPITSSAFTVGTTMLGSISTLWISPPTYKGVSN